MNRLPEHRICGMSAHKKSNIAVARERMSTLLSEEELRALFDSYLEALKKVIQVTDRLLNGQSASNATANDNLNENQTNEAT